MRRRPPIRFLRLVVAVSVAVLPALTGCRGRPGGSGSTSAATGAQPAAPTDTTSPTPHAAPRWETLTTFSGTGPLETPDFAIAAGAIQWRVRWSCDSGTLTIDVIPPPRRPGHLVASTCPRNGEGFSIRPGNGHMKIDASGPWKAIVDQQLDTPLDEAPPAELGASQVLGQGTFYNVEKSGKGSARLYRLADGRRILRFEDFEVSNNTDLFIWLTDSPEPRTSAEAMKAHRIVLGNLKSTLGNQNYELPDSVPSSQLRSVVVWCEPVAIAYSAARLQG